MIENKSKRKSHKDSQRRRKFDLSQPNKEILGDILNEEEDESEDKFIDVLKDNTNLETKNSRTRFDEYGIEITPFNMKEELDEGTIDKEGFYISGRKDE